MSISQKVKFALNETRSRLLRSCVVKEQTSNGETHLILLESMFDWAGETAEDLDKTEIGEIMKKEASKPLLLLRAE